MAINSSHIDPVRIQESIGFLKAYLNEQDLAPLITALEALSENVEDESRLAQLSDVFNQLSVPQGAILTYAPYIGVLLSDDPLDTAPAETTTDTSAPAAIKLVQKHPLKGTHEYEIVDDAIVMRIKKPFREEVVQHVMLTILNPEPEINGNMLDFHSRVKCGPLISLYLNKPNPEEFNAFVDAVKQKALKEFKSFAGIK